MDAEKSADRVRLCRSKGEDVTGRGPRSAATNVDVRLIAVQSQMAQFYSTGRATAGAGEERERERKRGTRRGMTSRKTEKKNAAPE